MKRLVLILMLVTVLMTTSCGLFSVDVKINNKTPVTTPDKTDDNTVIPPYPTPVYTSYCT